MYGLMRQESRFATGAKSETGAAGLMQIMPGTARWVASKLGLKSYRKALIHQLDTNLRIGTYYMKSVLAQSENNPVLASAAYNAGPIRALQWRGDKPLEGAIYAETIPYRRNARLCEKGDEQHRILRRSVRRPAAFAQAASGHCPGQDG